jgi:hypothetical protein
MKCWKLALVALIVLGASPGLSAAQTEPILLRDPDYWIRPAGGTVGDPPVPAVLPELCSPWSVNFVVGLPSGVRVQRLLGEEGRFNFQAEAFAGLELIFPMLGGGLRGRLVPLCGKNDALVLSPGVDAYILYNIFSGGGDLLGGGPSFIGLAAVDLDVSWRHTFRNHGEGEFGIKLGAGLPFGHRTSGTAVPVAGVFWGWRF